MNEKASNHDRVTSHPDTSAPSKVTFHSLLSGSTKSEQLDVMHRLFDNHNTRVDHLAGTWAPQFLFQNQLDKFYNSEPGQVGLNQSLNGLHMSPEAVRGSFQGKEKFGNPAIEVAGDVLSIYDRDNSQFRYQYDKKAGTYNFLGSLKAGDQGYKTPDRLTQSRRPGDVEAKGENDSGKGAPKETVRSFVGAIAHKDAGTDKEDWAIDATKKFNALLNQGNSLDQVIDSVNKAWHQPNRRDDVLIPRGSTRDPRMAIQVTPDGGLSGFNMNANRVEGKWTIQFGGLYRGSGD